MITYVTLKMSQQHYCGKFGCGYRLEYLKPVDFLFVDNMKNDAGIQCHQCFDMQRVLATICQCIMSFPVTYF